MTPFKEKKIPATVSLAISPNKQEEKHHYLLTQNLDLIHIFMKKNCNISDGHANILKSSSLHLGVYMHIQASKLYLSKENETKSDLRKTGLPVVKNY